MRVSSPIPHKKARIEIIPLIDIMFFLLASFMMVSLSQVHMKGIKVTLPPEPRARRNQSAITLVSLATSMARHTSTRSRSPTKS